MLDSVGASQEAAMDFSPFSLLVVKVFSLITGGLGAEACAQILKVPLEELEPIIAELKEGGLLQSDPDRPARIMITSRGVAELQIRNAWREMPLKKVLKLSSSTKVLNFFMTTRCVLPA